MSRSVVFVLLMLASLKLFAAVEMSSVNPQVKLETEKGDIVLELFPKKASYYFCKPKIQRGLDASYLKSIFESKSRNGSLYNSVQEALNSAKENSKVNDLIYIGGSTFVVAEVV